MITAILAGILVAFIALIWLDVWQLRVAKKKIAELKGEISGLKGTWSIDRKRINDAHEAELRALNFLLKTNYGIEIEVIRGGQAGTVIEAQAKPDIDVIEKFANRREGK